jgi:hypothetical protein
MQSAVERYEVAVEEYDQRLSDAEGDIQMLIDQNEQLRLIVEEIRC